MKFFRHAKAVKPSDHRQRLLAPWWRKSAVEFGKVDLVQFDVQRRPVLTHVVGFDRLRNGDDAFLPQDPGERDLRRGYAMSLGDGLQAALLPRFPWFIGE